MDNNSQKVLNLETKLKKTSKIVVITAFIGIVLLAIFAIYWFAIRCNHSYDETITTKPTCTTEGIKTFSCTKCNKSYTEIIKKDTNAHLFEEKIIQEATCTEEGQIAIICKYCGISSTKTIPASHEWNDATCLKPKMCKKCRLTEGEAKSHFFDDMGKCKYCGLDWTLNIQKPSLPKNLNYYSSNISSKIRTACVVEDMTFSCSKAGSNWRVTINVTIKKINDQDGSNANNECVFGIKILDDKDVVVDSGMVYSKPCRVGEKIVSSHTFNVPAIDNYKIEFFEDSNLHY